MAALSLTTVGFPTRPHKYDDFMALYGRLSVAGNRWAHDIEAECGEPNLIIANDKSLNALYHKVARHCRGTGAKGPKFGPILK